jgi:hypothetical protein
MTSLVILRGSRTTRPNYTFSGGADCTIRYKGTHVELLQKDFTNHTQGSYELL